MIFALNPACSKANPHLLQLFQIDLQGNRRALTCIYSKLKSAWIIALVFRTV